MKVNLFWSEGIRRQRLQNGDAYKKKIFRYGGKYIVIWACMYSKDINVLHLMDEFMNTETCCNALKETMYSLKV